MISSCLLSRPCATDEVLVYLGLDEGAKAGANGALLAVALDLRRQKGCCASPDRHPRPRGYG